MGISSVDTSINYGTNPCHYKTSNCSDLCFHKPRIGPVCECPTRMELHKDEKTCYGKLKTFIILYNLYYIKTDIMFETL